MIYLKADDADTICAVATAPGVGGIAVIRISGSRAAEIARALCAFLPAAAESHRLYHGLCKDAEGEPLDDVLVSYFAKGRSFTGEETIEISCHGGHAVTSSILESLIARGCRLAKPGEFTYRAFVGGRLDLVQAESVLALIESQSRSSAKVALRQLRGHLSRDFARIEDDIVWILAQIEASIDFSTEGLDVVSMAVMASRLAGLSEFVDGLLKSYRKGRLLQEGVRVAIVGRPNSGKSSLLNAILAEDRAIVTSQPGTTRDTVEGARVVDGVTLTFVDTAGLRESPDIVEQMGIKRSRAAMLEADFVLFLIDGSHADWPAELAEFQSEFDGRSIVGLNKTDTINDSTAFSMNAESIVRNLTSVPLFLLSAKTGAGVEDCVLGLAERVASMGIGEGNIVTQARHFELLQKIQSCTAASLRLIHEQQGAEFIAFELRDAVIAVHELLGKEFHEQVIDRVFKEFCLGK
jgi:tRNA modification GTPase